MEDHSGGARKRLGRNSNRLVFLVKEVYDIVSVGHQCVTLDYVKPHAHHAFKKLPDILTWLRLGNSWWWCQFVSDGMAAWHSSHRSRGDAKDSWGLPRSPTHVYWHACTRVCVCVCDCWHQFVIIKRSTAGVCHETSGLYVIARAIYAVSYRSLSPTFLLS